MILTACDQARFAYEVSQIIIRVKDLSDLGYLKQKSVNSYLELDVAQRNFDEALETALQEAEKSYPWLKRDHEVFKTIMLEWLNEDAFFDYLSLSLSWKFDLLIYRIRRQLFEVIEVHKGTIDSGIEAASDPVAEKSPEPHQQRGPATNPTSQASAGTFTDARWSATEIGFWAGAILLMIASIGYIAYAHSLRQAENNQGLEESEE